MKKLSFIIVFCLLLFASCNQPPANQNSDTPTESIGSVPSETTEPTMPETQPQTEPLTEPTVPDSDVVYDENGNFPAVVMYHLIMETPYNNNETLFVRPGDFEAQLQALTEAGYDFLFANDYNKTAGNSIILTFDDGYLDNYTTMFPLLKKYSAKATVFLISDMIGHPEYMNEAQIKEMADSGLVKFECHTASHPSLANLSDQQAEQEFIQSIAKIESITGQKVTALAYPSGSFNNKTVAIAQNYFNYCYCSRPTVSDGFPVNMAIPRYYASRNLSLAGYLDMIKG